MKQLGMDWNENVIKTMTLEKFKEIVQGYVDNGKLKKQSEVNIESAYYILTGDEKPKKVKTIKKQ